MSNIKCKKHFSNRDITCTECNDCFFANCRRQATDSMFNDLLKTKAGINTNIDTTTPITEEIILEAMEKINLFKKKEDMQKLLREFLEAIEKNNIKEILFFEQSKIMKKKGQAIFSY